MELFLCFWRFFESFEILLYCIVSVKYIFSYSFNRIDFKFHTDTKNDVIPLVYASFDDRIIFEFLAIFLKF